MEAGGEKSLQLHEDSWRCEGVFCVCTVFQGTGSVAFLRSPSKIWASLPLSKKKKVFKEIYSSCMRYACAQIYHGVYYMGQDPS